MSSSQGKGEMNRLWVEQKLWNWRGARKQEQVDTQLRLSRVLLPGGASPALSCPGFHTARCELLVAPLQARWTVRPGLFTMEKAIHFQWEIQVPSPKRHHRLMPTTLNWPGQFARPTANPVPLPLSLLRPGQEGPLPRIPAAQNHQYKDFLWLVCWLVL